MLRRRAGAPKITVEELTLRHWWSIASDLSSSRHWFTIYTEQQLEGSSQCSRLFFLHYLSIVRETREYGEWRAKVGEGWDRKCCASFSQFSRWNILSKLVCTQEYVQDVSSDVWLLLLITIVRSICKSTWECIFQYINDQDELHDC